MVDLTVSLSAFDHHSIEPSFFIPDTMASELRPSLAKLNVYLEHNSYIGSPAHATQIDFDWCRQMQGTVAPTTETTAPHFYRWFTHMSALMGAGEHAMSDGKLPRELQIGANKHPSARADAASADSTKSCTGSKGDSQASPLKYICVLDFEKTCEQDVQLDPQEIIEFPSVLVEIGDGKNCVNVAEFESFVKPTVHPKLTPFCTELTGITQASVDSALTLPAVLEQHHAWLTKHVGMDESCCTFLTCGDFDLKRSLPEDPNISEDYDQKVPAVYKRWHNLKKEFPLIYKHWYPKKKQPRNMTEMLEKLELQLEGKHHSGIDDCRNIANVVKRMLNNGWVPGVPCQVDRK